MSLNHETGVDQYPTQNDIHTPVVPSLPATDDPATGERGPRQAERLKTLSAGMMAWLVNPTSHQTKALTVAQEVEVGLQLRSLLPPANSRCGTCGLSTSHGHDDVCSLVQFRRIARHNCITKLIEVALKRLGGDAMVVREPHLIGDHHRTDLRVSGSAAPRGILTQFDFTFISTSSVDASRVAYTTSKQQLASGKGPWTAAQSALDAILTRKAATKTTLYQQRLALRGISFIPLVFTLEGAAHLSATNTLKHWKSVLPSFPYFFSCFSTFLLRSRAQTYALRQYDDQNVIAA
ncbi:hypothetical protein OC846_004415 [Tilletia horrida]|uniref:Uncharacterized protein n=1 Tax=Tilletia horrida TaxID=155126 RepID=A0AAN6GNQ7_9BASI|nr:hypothetical protein OC846_004415 [Tilletia horrida]